MTTEIYKSHLKRSSESKIEAAIMRGVGGELQEMVQAEPKIEKSEEC